MESKETPKEKFDKKQRNILREQMLDGILNGEKTIKEYAEERNLPEQRIKQILYYAMKERVLKKNEENEKLKQK